MLMAGINVGGYELSVCIGEGAFSKVYRATAVKAGGRHILHSTVAVKVLQFPSNHDEAKAYKKKVVKEVRLHKAVVHRNILRLVEFTEQMHSNSMWIILEYAEGGDLFDKITPDVGIPEDLAHLYFYQLIAALHYCHSSGIVHRDIKPENMLLDHSGNLKLADFGLADLFRYNGKEKKCTEACGSAPYAAPELALGVPYRAQPIDVWSAGIVLFTLLVGNTPWDQPTAGSPEYEAFVTGELLETDPWTRLSPECLAMLLSILHPNPKERYKISDLMNDPWFRIENPHLNKEGLVSSRNDLWSAVYAQMAQNGEFDIRPSQGGPSPDAPMASMPRSQGRARSVFGNGSGKASQNGGGNEDEEMEVEDVQAGEDDTVRLASQKQDHAKNAVEHAMLHGTMPSSTKHLSTGPQATAATQFSQCLTFAPSQLANPNNSRFFSYWDLPTIVSAIEHRLSALGAAHTYEHDSRGAAIRWKKRDRRKQKMSGVIFIMYEPTQDDYASIAPDASMQDIVRQRKGALTKGGTQEADEEEGVRIDLPGGRREGVGQGGYVVAMMGRGDTLERKRFFTDIETGLPDKLVFVK